jgi:hypothetical protein
MNKRRLHHYWAKIGEVKTWQLLVLAVLFAALTVFALRQNSLNLEPKINAVLLADETGEGIEQSINELGDYVTHHMNADLPRPIQLQYSYERAVEQAYQIELDNLRSGSLLEEAKAVCAQLGVVVSAGPQCIQDYLDENWTPDKGALSPELPDPALFTYNFASPSWSPDLAGFSMAITILLLVAAVSRLIAGQIVKAVLKSHQ